MQKSKNSRCSWHSILAQCFVGISCLITTSASLAVPSPEGLQIYQKNVHLHPDRKQRLNNDVMHYRNASNLWDVLRKEFTLPHYEDNPAVQAKIEWYMNNQDYLLRAATRAAPYLYYIFRQAKKRHLPAELVLLPVVESGYNPFSRSHMGATGLWQLMPGTATGLGVKNDWWYDGRRDVIASTKAALNYLSYLEDFFDGNWLLAIAAYNTGEGNIQSAIRKNIRAGKRTNFWSLPLARETKSYVPSLLALAVIISRPDKYPVYFPPVRNAPYLAQVDVKAQINLQYAAKLAGVSHRKLKRLNSGLNRPSTSARGPYKLILPIENVAEFAENLAKSPLRQRTLRWVHYKVKSGDSLIRIAKKFNTSAQSIRDLNNLKNDTIRRGADMLIPNQTFAAVMPPSSRKRKITKKSSPASKIKTAMSKMKASKTYSLKPGDTIYMMRSKDTLESIAKRFHLNKGDILAANNIKLSQVKPGKQLIIPTHISPDSSVQAGDTIYMVRQGDTLEKIAHKFRTTPAAIRLANLIDGNTLKAGQKILVPTRAKG